MALAYKRGDDPEEILNTLDREAFGKSDLEYDSHRLAFGRDYLQRLRERDSDTPARFSADPPRLFEASGEVMVLRRASVTLGRYCKRC